MKRATGLSIGLALLLIAAGVTPATAGPSLGADSRQVGDLESDQVIIDANVSENGTATFEIQYAIRLADDNDTQAFEDLVADIAANESAYLTRFADRLNATVDAAETSTGRPMAVRNFDVTTNTATLGKEYGLVTYSATWTNFAKSTETGIAVGDALEGLFIDSDTRFQISWNDGYAVDSVSPEPSESTDTQVAWDGPREFTNDQPSVTLVSGSAATEPEPTTTPPTEGGDPPWILLVIALVLAAVAAAWYRRQQTDSSTVASTEREATSSDEPDESSPPPELLSNEERVKEYLESEGGRAKQQEIVDALGWTEAKTSQVLSDMESEDSIEKFRIGRENVVKLPDVDDEFN